MVIGVLLVGALVVTGGLFAGGAIGGNAPASIENVEKINGEEYVVTIQVEEDIEKDHTVVVAEMTNQTTEVNYNVALRMPETEVVDETVGKDTKKVDLYEREGVTIEIPFSNSQFDNVNDVEFHLEQPEE